MASQGGTSAAGVAGGRSPGMRLLSSVLETMLPAELCALCAGDTRPLCRLLTPFRRALIAELPSTTTDNSAGGEGKQMRVEVWVQLRAWARARV